VKLAVVVQRYGADINGGAELHARYVAEHLSRHAEVEVLTTCAHDYITWRNEHPAGEERIGPVVVRRFPVSQERDVHDFGRRSAQVFEQPHSWAQEVAWLASEGPTSPALISFIQANRSTFDYFIFFSYRYYHAYHGVQAAHGQALLVPTAERDPAIGMAIFRPVFRGVRALMYNSFEERAMIPRASANEDVPGVVVGIGSDVPERTNAARFRQKFGINDRFIVYVGRIDDNKGCGELFRFFEQYATAVPRGFSLVLIGRSILTVPDNPRIRHLGFLDDTDKFDAMAAADLLVMPSYFESLSMVALEAWAMGKPVVANARCDVLKGQCIRSNAGLFYDSFEEFFEILRFLGRDRRTCEALGRNGREYFLKHYAWPVIERKYLDMLDQLKREDAAGQGRRDLEAPPGLFHRWRKRLPPAQDVVAGIPAGPEIPAKRPPVRRPPRPAHRGGEARHAR
jgi:glycosyltransferase involved in cell wall biosynthesis